MNIEKKKARVQSTVADRLKQRGLYNSITRYNGHIVSNHTYYPEHLQYPVFDLEGHVIGTRAKFFDWERKYGWIPSRPDHPLADWYIVPDAIQAIKDSNGVCYLANGEPSTLALLTSQVYNTICTTQSEISIPSNLVTVLERLGVRELRYLSDNDRAGWDSAIKWRDALLTTDIQFVAYQWGKELKPHTDDKSGKQYMACVDKPAKYDANDLWIDCGFDIQAMQDAMNNLVVMHLPQPEVKTEKEKAEQGNYKKTPQGLIGAIKSRLRITGKKQKKNGLECHCPHHDDKNPSATFYEDSGVLICWSTCSKTYSTFENADELLGKDVWHDYYEDNLEDLTEDQRNIIQEAKKYKKAKAAYDSNKLEAAAAAYNQANSLYLYDKPALPGGGHYVGLPKPKAPLNYPGAYQSWINQQHIPISWLTSILSLTDGRSAVARVFLEMHEAFRIGKIDSQNFTRKDIVNGLNLPRKSTEAALETMLEWGFVSILDTIYYVYIDTETESTQNYSPRDSDEICENKNDTKPSGGRPSIAYRINTDTDIMRCLLADMIERYIVETHTKKSLAPRLMALADDFGLSYEDWKQWSERTQSGLDSRVKHDISSEIEKFRTALWSDLFYPIDLSIAKSSKDIRSQLLVHFLSQPGRENGIQITDGRLARFLGCTTGNLSAIYKSSNVTTERRFKKYEVDTPHHCQLDKEIAKAQRENQGAATGMTWKRVSDGQWAKMVFGHDAMQKAYYRNRTNMARLIIHIEQPSIKRFKTVDEWLTEYEEKLDKERIRAKDKAIDNGELIQEEKIEQIAQENVNKLKRTQPQKTTTDRNWSQHDYHFAYEQLQLEVHVFTEYQLKGNQLKDADNQVIQSFTGIKHIVRYLNEYAKSEPVRTIDSFYGKDDSNDTELLIGEAELLGGQVRTGDKPIVFKPIEVNVKAKTPKPDKPMSETERKRLETLELFKYNSRREYLAAKAGA